MFKKLIVALLIAGGLIGATYGAAANIVVRGGNVGAGNGTITGYKVHDTLWTTNFATEGVSGEIVAVDFTLTPATPLTSVDVTTDSQLTPVDPANPIQDSLNNWACVTDVNGDANFSDVHCDADTPVDAQSALNLRVVAQN